MPEGRRRIRVKKAAPPVAVGGVTFGPTSKGKMYVSTMAHRGHRSRRQKSRWSIPPKDEFALFDESDANDWYSPNGHLWNRGDDEGRRQLGERGERLAKFPKARRGVPWHGYPVSPRFDGPRGRPDDDLIERWVEDKTITRTFARRLQADRI
jgi:hypothetical protein